MNSIICDYIKDHPRTWFDDFDKLNIRVKTQFYTGIKDRNGTLAIFNYGVGADFSNPIVQEARGIIIWLEECKVVCWPFRKFGNWSEPYADQIDWRYAEVQEKVDGSIIKHWHNPITDKFQWSTNGVMDAKDAKLSSNPSKTYFDLIQEAIDYSEIDKDTYYSMFETHYGITDIFELVSPENKIVIQYPVTNLYYLGSRSTINGAEFFNDEFVGYFPMPHRYSLDSFKKCMKAVDDLNTGDEVTQEGFVIVDTSWPGGWHRIKIKSPQYVALHHAVSSIISKDKVVDLIYKGIDENQLPDARVKCVLHFYKYALAELEYKIDRYIEYVRNLNEELNGDRKAVANTIKEDRLAPFGFKALDTDKKAAELMDNAPRNLILKLLPDYQLPIFKEVKEWQQ